MRFESSVIPEGVLYSCGNSLPFCLRMNFFISFSSSPNFISTLPTNKGEETRASISEIILSTLFLFMDKLSDAMIDALLLKF